MNDLPRNGKLRNLTRKLLIGTVVFYGLFFALHALRVVPLDETGVRLLGTGFQSIVMLYAGRAATERAAWAYERKHGYYTPASDPYIQNDSETDATAQR